MEPANDTFFSLSIQERALLLDTVISALGKYEVEVFQARDPALRVSLDQRRQLMESILKKLLIVSRESASEQKDVAGEAGKELKGKAA